MKKYKVLYYILNLTWGLPLTFVGALVALAMIVSGHKPKKHAGCIYFNVGKNWGGLELGLFFLVDEVDYLQTKDHEFGHSLQNCIWGPLMIFVICIPSAIRYWWRQLHYYKHGKVPSTEYDDIWFEKQASEWGQKYSAQWFTINQ